MIAVAVVVALVACASALPQIQRVDPNANWRIVGGSNAVSGQFPYIGSLRSAANNHFCGASILTNRWALTAAHCVVGTSTAGLGIQVGTHLITTGGTRHSLSRIILHAGYNPSTIQNDIAVVETVTTIAFTALVQQVALSTVTTGGGVPVTLSGWGTTSNGGSIPNNLQWLGLNTITVAQCQSTLAPNPVTATQICAVIGSGQGACHGDSGGPLVLNSNSAQVGIVSWGIPCGVGFPDVYARVSSFIQWIINAVNS